MFRRLRERIAEEATKFPVGQNFGGNPLRTPDTPSRASENVEDLITLSDSSAVIEPFASSPQFSIAGDEDASFSDPNSPQKKVANSSAGSELYATPNNKGMFEANSVQSPKAAVPAYIPQTDIESEVEESPTLNLDGISKEQLLSTIEILKARLCKYKNKYGEVVKAYKNMNEEKKKLEHALTENQDKSLRRIGELREQCQLEQKAKAHLEENLRLILEEKDSRISVLETQINLLKESQSSNVPVEIEQVEQNSVPSTPENVALQEKIQKLQALLKECKTTIMSKTEQIAELSKEKEALCQKVVTQSKASEEFEEKEANIRMEYDQIIEGLKNRLAELERQQEDSVMSMAETKKNMHEELELKERQLVKTKEEARQLQLAVDHEKSVNLELRKQLEEKLRELQTRLETTEQIMEEGKQNLVKELSRGKAEAVALIQQESAKRIASIEQECSEKLKELEFTLSEKLKKKEEELMSATSKEEELNAAKNDVEALKSQLEAVEKEKASLETRVRELESQDQMQSESASSFEKIQKYEAEISELKRELSQLEEVKNRLVSDYDSKVSSMEEELKIKLDEQSTEFLSKLDSKEVELRQLVSSAETREKELKESANKLQAELALKQSALERVEKELSLLKSSDCEKMEEFLRKIKQLEQEREQLMLQAQERVAATELKFREDIAQLQGKVNDLQEQNKEIAKLKSENSKLSYQLDESLLVAAGNQSAVEKELSRLREHIQHLNEKLSEKDKEVNNKDQELSQTLSDLGEKDALVDNLKQEKDSLNEKLQSLEMQLNHSKELEQKVMSLKDENSNLRSELDSLATVKQEKDELNSKISSLERLKRDLDESVMLLKTENDVLKASEVSLKEELNSLVSEKDTLADQLRQLEKSDSKCPDCAALECNLKDICDEYEEKLRVKDAEVEEKLKLVIKDFYSQLNIKDYDCDLTVSELLEQSKSIEEKLEKEHKLEVAALQQDIFEKDFALEEMHEHYETIIKEKDATIRDYEKKLKYHPGGAANAELQATEPSDWDDTWVVPEESCEAVSPSPTNKADCDKHKKEIETLQEELEKCNTELKDLRILLRLTPPQSLHSNNNYSSMIPISEPTEFEYLKNILFEYMMGKETVTLVKVIAAVLKFSDEQTRLIIEREKSKHQAK